MAKIQIVIAGGGHLTIGGPTHEDKTGNGEFDGYCLECDWETLQWYSNLEYVEDDMYRHIETALHGGLE